MAHLAAKLTLALPIIFIMFIYKWMHFCVFRYFILVTFIKFMHSIAYPDDENSSIYKVRLSAAVTFHCEGGGKLAYYWKQEENILNVGTRIIDHRFTDKFTVFENFSVLINPVSLSDEGRYQCCHNTNTTVVAYLLFVTGQCVKSCSTKKM